MEFKKYHRRYPDRKWDYKAVSTKINEDGKITEIIYYNLVNKGKFSKGVETYTGKNYIVGSTNKSNSRQYSLTSIPEKYKNIVSQLMNEHSKNIWSKESRVDLN